MDETLNALAARDARDPLPIQGRLGACSDVGINRRRWRPDATGGDKFEFTR
jgi:hypothetical protein